MKKLIMLTLACFVSVYAYQQAPVEAFLTDLSQKGIKAEPYIAPEESAWNSFKRFTSGVFSGSSTKNMKCEIGGQILKARNLPEDKRQVFIEVCKAHGARPLEDDSVIKALGRRAPDEVRKLFISKSQSCAKPSSTSSDKEPVEIEQTGISQQEGHGPAQDAHQILQDAVQEDSLVPSLDQGDSILINPLENDSTPAHQASLDQ